MEMIVIGSDRGVSGASQAAVPSQQLASLFNDVAAAPRQRTQLAATGVAMRTILALAARMARVDVPVLIRGESGAGKAMVARLIHELSPRSQHTFAELNCQNLSPGAAEHEIFGYEEVSITHHRRRKPGILERSSRGTVLLDEVAALPSRLQARLVDVLDSGRFARAGGYEMVHVDTRIIFSARDDIAQEVSSGRLRSDLYSRLTCLTLQLPPLRGQKEEMPGLYVHYLGLLAREQARVLFPAFPELPEARRSYSWLGRNGEFEDSVSRLALLGEEALAMRSVKGKGGKAGGALGNANVSRYAS